MNSLEATELLSALGQESRLNIFRQLVVAGTEGMIASAIGEQLRIPSTTLSFHLSHLTRAGLIRGERENRFIRYVVNFATIDDLIAYLTESCCQGKNCLPNVEASKRASRRCSEIEPAT